MTKTELLSDLKGQVIKILAENPVGQAAGGIQPIEVVCLVTVNAAGDVNRRVQTIYLDTETGACYYGENRVRNYAAPTPEQPKDDKLFNALELMKTAGIFDSWAICADKIIDNSLFRSVGMRFWKNGNPCTFAGGEVPEGEAIRYLWENADGNLIEVTIA
jgi:hypothetical protein